MFSHDPATDAAAAEPVGIEDGLRLLELVASGFTIGDLKGMTREALEAMYGAAHGLYMQGRYDEARRAFGFGAIHNHLDRRFFKGIAACLQMKGRHEDAMKYWGVVNLMDSTDPMAALQMAECMLALGRRDEAERTLASARQRIRDEPRHAAQAARIEALLELSARKQQAHPPADATADAPG